MAGSGIDTAGLKRLSVQLKAASRNERREWRNGLKDVGEMVANEARIIIEPVSKRTAASIHVRAAGRAGTAVVAGGTKDLRIAALLEGKGVPGEWKHPVYGNRQVWVSQKRHPYMLPAYEHRRHEVGAILQKYVARGIEEAGLHVR